MKAYPSLLLAAALAAVSLHAADAAAPSNVTVTFKDPDKFTDARSRFNSQTDQYYLDILQEHLTKTATKRLATGQKLEVTITDVDLAGDFMPLRAENQDVRIIKDIYVPRIALTFKLTGPDGKILKEGERSLTDLNFMNDIGLFDRNQPLYHDKALLTDWIKKEFKS